MTGILALLVRSLRVDARLLRTHLFRLLFVGMIYLSLMTTQANWHLTAPGLSFFLQIAWINFFLITIAGVSVFASVITEEKEEGTLGLLTMAGISPVALLLGKAMPRLLSAALLLSVQLPFTFLAITLGGVTMHQVLAAYWSLLAWTVMLAALGLVASVICRRSRGAGWFAGTSIFLLFFLPGWIAMIPPVTATLQWLQPALGYLANASPVSRLWSIMQTGFEESAFSYQVIANFAAAAVLFGLAWLLFNAFNREERPAGPEPGLRFGRGGRRGRLRAGRAWENPFVWKDFHFLAGGRSGMAGKFVAYGLLIVGLIWFTAAIDSWREPIDASFVGGVMMMTMLVTLLIEAAIYAARVFHDEVQWKTLSGLMMLPLSAGHVAYSKVAGCLIGLIPAAAYFAVGGLLHPKALAEAVESLLSEAWGWYVILTYVLFLHLTAFLSLVLKRGALPLAFVAIVVFNWSCLGLLAINGAGEEVTVVLNLLCISFIAVLHFGIGARLSGAAAE